MGFSVFGSSGLIIGGVLGQGVATTILGKLIWKEDSYRLKELKKLKILILAKRYIKFPTWNLFSSFLYTIKENILTIVFSKYFEISYIGYYFFAKKLLLVPSNILISAFSDVFFQKITKIEDYNEIFEVSYEYFKRLFIFLTIPYIIFVILLQYIVPFVFGDKWIDLNIYLLIISFPIYFNILLGRFSKILLRINYQEISFYFHLFKLIFFILILIVILKLQLIFLKALIVISIFETIFVFLGILLIKGVVQVKANSSYLLFTLCTVLVIVQSILYEII